MFSNINKSAFGGGTSTPSFGFGTNSATNQTPFGQSQLFGKSTATTGFGTTAPLFGTTSQPSGGTLFSSSSVPSFGSTPQAGFGTGLFGQQQNTTGGNGLFANTGGTAFGQQNKTAGFGFGTTTATPLFGQQQPQNFQPSTSSGVFGSAGGFGGTTQMGTVVKFNPVNGTDTMQKSGITQSISTKHHCITCMKEYEAKSLEELRWEDYQCNRRGPQQQNSFGGSPFGAPASTAPSLFGQTENKPAFGQSTTFGGGNTFGLTTQQNQQSLFGKPAGAFGTTPTTNAFGSFNTATPGFGTNTGIKPFGTQTTQNVFGTATTQPSAFGTSFFGQTSTQNTNTFFNKPAQTAFNTQQPLFTFGQQTTAQSSLFQPSKPTTGFPSFGQTNQTSNSGFGQQPNIFSQTQQNPFNAFQKPAQPPFGQQLQSGFGLGTQAGTNTFFGGNKPLFGTTTQSSFFSPPAGGFMMQQQQQPIANQSLGGNELQSQPDFHTIVEQLYEPFPHRELFDGIEVKNYISTEATNPTILKKIIEDAPLPMTPSVDISKLRIMPQPKLNTSGSAGKFSLLENTVSPSTPQNNFILQGSSGKRLVLRKSTPKTEKDLLEQYKSMAAGSNNNATNNKNRSIFKNNIFEELNGNEVPSNSEANELPKTTTPLSAKLLPLKEFGDSTEKAGEKGGKTVRFIDEDLDMSTKCSSPSNLRYIKDLEGVDKIFKSPGSEESTHNSDDEDANITPSPKEPHYPCGVKLTRQEYYTIPPYEELHKYKTENNACIVKGFTIGRHGFGNVYFPDQMDISNLDLDEVVHFGFRNVTLYPDDSKKPPIGQGLNRPAKVTLDHVWPRHRETHELLKDPKDIAGENFIERLALLAERQNAELVDYNPETGSWVFTVKHFSKYHFTDADDEEVAQLINKREQEQQRKEIEKKKVEESISVFETEDEMQDMAKRGLGGIASYDMNDSSPRDVIFHQSLSQARLASAFREDAKNALVMKSSFFDEESISDDVSSSDIGIVHHFSVPATTLSSRIMVGVQKKTKIQKPKYYPLINHHHIVPIGKSLLTSNNYMDVALFKSRSFKIGWGPGFTFMTVAAPSNTDSPSILEKNKQVVPNTVIRYEIEDLSSKPQMMYLEKHLNVVFEKSTVTVDASGVPLFRVNDGYGSLIRHQDIAELVDKDFEIDISYYKEVWNLCLALWGPNASSPTNRCELLSKWLEDIAAPHLKKELELFTFQKSAIIKNIFIYLTGHKVQEAAELAMGEGFPRLSALVAQSSAHNDSKLFIYEQLEQWKTSGAINTIDKNILKIYMLLGGVSFISDINVFENLNWKRALALHLWYMCRPGTSLIHAVRSYQESFMSLGYSNRPSPEHYEFTTTTVYDILYQILLLYGNNTMPLEKVVNPTTYTEDPLDYRLSWLLLQVFTSLKVGTISHEVNNAIHISFSSQLENLGLWKWAIFVLLFIQDSSAKQNIIMGILDRNLNPDRTSESNLMMEDSLVNDFKIPPEWIHAVLANKTNLMGKNIETYKHLILENDWCEANNVAITHLIPEFISTGQCEKLINLLQCLLPGMRNILHWHTQTGLVLDFLRLHQKVTQSKEMELINIHQLRSDLTGLCCRLKDFPTKSLKQILALAELSRFVAILLKIVYCELEPSNNKNVQSASELIKVLFMPPDYKHDELMKYIQQYLIVEN